MEGITVDSVTEQSLQSFTIGHGDELEVFRRFVRADGRRAGAGDAPYGVCRIASTTRGELLPVDSAGLVQVEAGVAIPLGPGGFTLIKPGADGRAVPVGNLDPDPAAGIAVQAAAAGGFVPTLLLRADPMRTMQVAHSDANQVLNRFVTAAGARCAAGEQQVGVSLTESDMNGDQLRVQVYGIAMVLSGAAIVLAQGSQKVKSDTQGRAITHSGDDPVGGLALTAAAAAAVAVPVLLGGF